MMRDATAQWAKDELAPLVRQMDDAGKMEPHIIQACFDSGFMGVEVPDSARHVVLAPALVQRWRAAGTCRVLCR